MPYDQDDFQNRYEIHQDDEEDEELRREQEFERRKQDNEHARDILAQASPKLLEHLIALTGSVHGKDAQNFDSRALFTLLQEHPTLRQATERYLLTFSTKYHDRHFVPGGYDPSAVAGHNVWRNQLEQQLARVPIAATRPSSPEEAIQQYNRAQAEFYQRTSQERTERLDQEQLTRTHSLVNRVMQQIDRLSAQYEVDLRTLPRLSVARENRERQLRSDQQKVVRGFWLAVVTPDIKTSRAVQMLADTRRDPATSREAQIAQILLGGMPQLEQKLYAHVLTENAPKTVQ